MYHWTIAYSNDGFTVELQDQPLYVTASETVGDWLMHATGHFLCCNIPSWAYRVPIGRPKYDTDGELTNDLGYLLYRIGNKLQLPFSPRRTKRIASLPITTEQARALDEDFTSILVD